VTYYLPAYRVPATAFYATAKTPRKAVRKVLKAAKEAGCNASLGVISFFYVSETKSFHAVYWMDN
jgi:uncharacterized protein (UPF0128 family)